VFDVPAAVIQGAPYDPLVTVALAADPRVTTSGRVREVAPQADPVTRTFQVRVALHEPPPEMRLGSTVNGSLTLGGAAGIEIPASALVTAERQPAVWVVDPATGTVALRPVQLARHEPASVLVADGLRADEVIVTAGVQVLRPGQRVRLLDERP
jgi:RND family efflux transporter MFP subunit